MTFLLELFSDYFVWVGLLTIFVRVILGLNLYLVYEWLGLL